jgi:hypothetical protein
MLVGHVSITIPSTEPLEVTIRTAEVGSWFVLDGDLLYGTLVPKYICCPVEFADT